MYEAMTAIEMSFVPGIHPVNQRGDTVHPRLSEHRGPNKIIVCSDK